MPTVPRVTQPSVAPVADATPFQQIRGATPEAFGAAQGRANEALGGSLQKTGDLAHRIVTAERAENNERDAKRYYLEYVAAFEERTKGLIQSEGQNALDVYGDTLKEADAVGKEFLDLTSNNKVVNRGLQLAIQGHRLEAQKRFDSHLTKQKRVVDDNQYTHFLQSFINDGIEGYQTFGAADVDDETADLVARSEVRIRALASDKAKRDGSVPAAKEREAVSQFYTSVVKGAIANGDASTALRIFNANREKVPGEQGVALKNFLKDQTTNNVALSMARSIYNKYADLPEGERLEKMLLDIANEPDYSKYAATKSILESLAKSDAQIKGLKKLPEAASEIRAMKDAGASDAAILTQINEEKDPIKRAAKIDFFNSLKTIGDAAKKEAAENFAADLYLLENSDAKAAMAAIKKQFSEDSESQKIALDHLKSLEATDSTLNASDLGVRADKTKKSILAEVDKETGTTGASNAEQKALAILKAEDIKDPAEKALVLTQINGFFSSVAALDAENEKEAATNLANATLGLSVSERIAKIRGDLAAPAAVKDLAVARVKEQDAARIADERTTLDAAKAAINNHIIKDGGSIQSFQAANPEAFDVLSSDSFALGNAERLYVLTQQGKVYPSVSNPKLVRQLEGLSADKKADINIDATLGLLSKGDHDKLLRQVEGAKLRRDSHNEKLVNSINSLVETMQPRRGTKNKKYLNDDVLEAVKLEVLVQAKSGVDAGGKLNEEELKKLIMAEFTVVKSDPENTGFLGTPRPGEESIGGGAEDVAALVLPRMSVKQLQALRVDIDRMHPTLRLQAEKMFKQANPGEEPSDSDLEVTAAGLIQAYIKAKGLRK